MTTVAITIKARRLSSNTVECEVQPVSFIIGVGKTIETAVHMGSELEPLAESEIVTTS
jgi:hypothetical protein